MNEPKRTPLAPPDLEADTLAAKLRGYEPEIEALLKRRIRRTVIQDLLAQKGIQVSLNYLSVFMSRQRRRARDAAALASVPVFDPRPRPSPPSPVASQVIAPDMAPSSRAPNAELLEAALDLKRRDEKADYYLNKNRSVIGRNRRNNFE